MANKKNELNTLEDNFKEVDKVLQQKQKSFNKESIFRQNEIEKINRVINFYQKHSNDQVVLKKTLRFLKDIVNVNEEIQKINLYNFDQELD